MISGLPYLAMASFRASTQKSASMLLDNRQDNTLRLYQSMIATKYKNPRCMGMCVISTHQTWLTPGSHGSLAGLATSGTLTHWFRDRFARELDRDEAFGVLAAEAAATSPGAGGLLMLPYFSGERTPIHDPDAKGAFFGLNLTHDRGHMYRALIEGIGFGTRHVIETFEAAGQRPNRVLAVGGGTRNAMWLQATSDISGLDQLICEKTVGASYGDALMAACAVGAAEMGDIVRWNPVVGTVKARHHPIYDHQYRLFRRLYEQTRDIAAELAAR